MHWLQLQFTSCEALPSVWICFAWQYSQACGHPCCLCTFSYPISSFQSTLNLICFDTAIPFSNDPLWLNLFVEGVSDRLLDHCQVSSVPHYCAFKEQDKTIIYTLWMIIYWNSNVNIIIFWDNDFWLSLAVSSNHQKYKKIKLLKCSCGSVVEHCVSNAKGCGFNFQGTHMLINYIKNCIAWLHCKSLWIKASGKCVLLYM